MKTFKSPPPDLLAWIGEHIPAAGRPVDVSGGVRTWPLPVSGARGGLSATEQ